MSVIREQVLALATEVGSRGGLDPVTDAVADDVVAYATILGAEEMPSRSEIEAAIKEGVRETWE